MPFFAFVPWLAGLFGSLITWFSSFLAKKWAIRLAVIGVFIAITLTFTATINAILFAIKVSIPRDSWYQIGLSLLPTNMIGCMGAYIAAHVVRWVYDYKMGFAGRWIEQGL